MTEIPCTVLRGVPSPLKPADAGKAKEMLNEENPEFIGEREEPQGMPTLLFRYMKLEYLEPILKGRGLFFPKLSSFNDPFDANIFPSFKATKAERRKFYDAMLKSKGMNRGERKRRLKETKDRVDDTLMEEAYGGLLPNFPPIISRVRRFFRPPGAVAFPVL
jgi:hypothetical protein